MHRPPCTYAISLDASPGAGTGTSRLPMTARVERRYSQALKTRRARLAILPFRATGRSRPIRRRGSVDHPSRYPKTHSRPPDSLRSARNSIPSYFPSYIDFALQAARTTSDAASLFRRSTRFHRPIARLLGPFVALANPFPPTFPPTFRSRYRPRARLLMLPEWSAGHSESIDPMYPCWDPL